MKLAVFGDVHGNQEALLAVLKDISRRNPEGMYCVGDLVGYGPFPNEVIEKIRGEGIPTVQGNYDEGVGRNLMACGCDYKDEQALTLGAKSLFWSQEHVTEENKQYLKDLPAHLSERFGKWQVNFVHGSPRANNEYLFEDNEAIAEIVAEMAEDLLVCGHTHRPYHKEILGKHVINAGSVGKPKHGTPEATYIMIEFGADSIESEICYVQYDVDKTASALEASGLPVEYAEMLRSGQS